MPNAVMAETRGAAAVLAVVESAPRRAEDT
jgi:hypothetical protein